MMLSVRVIPVLLLKGQGLYKTVKFKDPVYVGDPLNTVRLFTEKEADELICLDITASREGRAPNFELLTDIATETFMPFAYGGGITNVEEVRRLFYIGAEKVVINSSAYTTPELIDEVARQFGSQSIAASIDAKKKMFGGYEVLSHGGTKKQKRSPVEAAKEMENRGAGEIFINSIDQDGTLQGFDLDLVRQVAEAVSVPVVACGGGSSLADFRKATDAGASAVSAGSFFVFQGKHKAVLITYPTPEELAQTFA